MTFGTGRILVFSIMKFAIPALFRFASLTPGLPLVMGAAAGDVTVPTVGMTVDTSTRSAVVAFWNRYYLASEGADAEMDWTGSYGAVCDPGTTSIRFVEAIERRINFYRALAGIGSDTVTNTGSTVVIRGDDAYKPSAGVTKMEAAQWAALMFSYAGQVSHNPPPSALFPCWGASSWNAAKNSNLTVGFAGPEAVDVYMRENDPTTLSVWSSAVGHRRWILNPGATDFATGDVPGSSPFYRPANVLYAFPSADETVSVPPGFVAWPPSGYFPDELMPKLWSLSHPKANFTGATVMVTGPGGSPVAATVVDRNSNFGDPAIVWSMPDAVATNSVAADTGYEVTVSGILIAGQSVEHRYGVTVFDPDVIPDPLNLKGTPKPPLSGANYFFDPVEGAERHAIVASVREPVTWVLGAENGESVEITDGTPAAYDLRATHDFKRSGSRAFRLVFPSQSELGDQYFIIEEEVIGGSAGLLKYYFRRGYMTPGTEFQVSLSRAGGAWEQVDSVFGRVDNLTDPSFQLRTVPLPEGLPVRVKFTLRYHEGSLFPLDTPGTQNRAGAFIDDISFTDAERTVSSAVVEAQPGRSHVRLRPSLLPLDPGEGRPLALQFKVTIGGRDYSAPQPMLVTPVETISNFNDWFEAELLPVGGGFDGDHDGDGLGNGLEYAFSLDPLEASSLDTSLEVSGGNLQLSVPLPEPRSDVIYRMEVSENLIDWSEVVPQVVDGVLVGSSGIAGDKAYARWKVSLP